MLALELLFIIALAPVITIVRKSGGNAVSWSSGMAAKFYVAGSVLVDDVEP